MTDFVICHGAWGGGWAWRRIRRLLRDAGHDVLTPTYTGLGERIHLTHPLIDLETHIRDIMNVIVYEDLNDIVLVGHSYGGMVATGVADRLAERIRHLFYLDAFVPADGQSVSDLASRGPGTGLVDGWLAAPSPQAPDTSAEDLAWSAPRRHHQPAGCFAQKLRLSGTTPRFPRSYIHCTVKPGGDAFRQFADRFRDDPAWHFHEMPTGHGPHVSAPEALAALLLGAA